MPTSATPDPLRENGESTRCLAASRRKGAGDGIDKTFANGGCGNWHRLAGQHMRPRWCSRAEPHCPPVPFCCARPKFLDGSMSLGQ